MGVLLAATLRPMNTRCQSMLHSFMLRFRTYANLLLDLDESELMSRFTDNGWTINGMGEPKCPTRNMPQCQFTYHKSHKNDTEFEARSPPTENASHVTALYVNHALCPDSKFIASFPRQTRTHQPRSFLLDFPDRKGSVTQKDVILVSV